MPRPSIIINDPDTSQGVCASNRIMAGMGRPGMGRPGMGRPGMGRPGLGRPTAA
ncbi:hypothetical protein [Achromobacter sp. UMC46]|uniref:hypothetical protein n=1 Tax=Achromobacter sp. UMC46 TaxID=1862319 RepID=UPI001C7EE7AB|nr:hypothetical protein [Achromobacter sp. UMC46]